MLRLIIVFTLSCAVTSVASAQQLTARQALELARNHMEQGQELYGSGRFVEAAEEFEQVCDHGDVLYIVGKQGNVSKGKYRKGKVEYFIKGGQTKKTRKILFWDPHYCANQGNSADFACL